jgi:hypothetical protein
MYTRWDLDRYMAYRRAKNTESSSNVDQCNHVMIGRQYIVNGKRVTITQVIKQWWAGWYLLAVYVDANESHGTVVIDNISCIDDTILSDMIQRFGVDFIPC